MPPRSAIVLGVSGTALREVILVEITADAVQSATVDGARNADGNVVGLSVLGIGGSFTVGPFRRNVREARP